MTPRDDIEVTVGDSGDLKQVTIADRKSQRAWSGEAPTIGQAATEATRKMLSDRRAKEYVG